MGILRSSLVAALLTPSIAMASPAVRSGPAPSWVRPVAVPDSFPVPRARIRGGIYSLLVDIQYNRAVRPAETWFHFADHVVNEEGVESASQVACEFDPELTQLTVHRVVIHRDGHRFDRLDPAKFRLIQREPSLEMSVYTGARTALLLVDDVRPGDTVELAYSIRGENPVLGGHFESLWPMAWSAPTGHVLHRLLWPSDRPITIRPLGSDVRPTLHHDGTNVEYLLSSENGKVLEFEDDVPDWYDPQPLVQISDFASWNEVARWGAALYRIRPDSPHLRDRVAALQGPNHDLGRRALAAIAFVQDGIRYLGIELGENSHRPTPPDVVLARRFGDCKDKALLLVAILGELGIPAHVAFVSASRREGIRDWAPAPLAFDHAIVCFEYGGQRHWVDPTAQAVRAASLDELDVSAFGPALVLDDTTTTLTTVTQPIGAQAWTLVTKEFDARSLDEPAKLTVTTRYKGHAANRMRVAIRAMNTHEMSRGYRDFYAKLYPNVVQLAEPEIADDESSNVVRVVEKYRISDFWKTSARTGKRYASFDAAELGPVGMKVDASRAMPLAIGIPGHIICGTRALMPPGWSAPPESIEIDRGPIRFKMVGRNDHGVLLMSHELHRASDHVAASEAGGVAEALTQIEDDLAYATYPGRNTSSTPGGPSLPAVAAVLLGIAIGAGTARRYYLAHRALASEPAGTPNPEVTSIAHDDLHQPAPAEAPTLAEGSLEPAVDTPADVPATVSPLPIGGWLILLSAGVAVTPVFLLATGGSTWKLLSAGYWHTLLQTELAQTHSGFGALVLFELTGNTMLVAWSLANVILLAQQRRAFPRAWILFTAGNLVFLLLDTVGTAVVLAKPDPTEVAGIFRGAVVLAIWGSYLMRSQRVAETFVR